MKQGIPVNVNTSTELHKITLQGKQERNWVEEHAIHIAKWAAHATIADAPPFHGEMSYNDEYMVWFCPRTLRHITKENSYWYTGKFTKVVLLQMYLALHSLVQPTNTTVVYLL